MKMPYGSSIPSQSDRVADSVLAYTPDTKEVHNDSAAPIVKAWSASVAEIFENRGYRLDATHYDPYVAAAKHQLEESGYTLEPLRSLASVELRSQFTRIWAKDEQHGIKYLNATDLLSLMALGVPSGGARYLSSATETNVVID